MALVAERGTEALLADVVELDHLGLLWAPRRGNRARAAGHGMDLHAATTVDGAIAVASSDSAVTCSGRLSPTTPSRIT